MEKIRVRFAPSPTGYLHIGGIRTALYNYLYARKYGGTFILRIEDTDQKRYVAEAEEYIEKALEWCGIEIDEGPAKGGDYGPYRQSERSEIYRKYADQLIESGDAYYAFDTEKELEAMRERKTAEGIHSPKYDASIRMEMKNSLTLSPEEVKERLESGEAYTIRIKVPKGEIVQFEDRVRGKIEFSTDELDDKVLIKTDGLPTYHMANIVDDYSMGISDVIRGEEWLSSTAHHVLLYRMLGLEDKQPRFSHLPLILKPSGKGKLSKRDGATLGIPVFPLQWTDEETGDVALGFDKMGFHPGAVVNFLAFLGWNPGTEQEIFSEDELIEAFSLEHISKGGARFDFDKALWFNRQYIMAEDISELGQKVANVLRDNGHAVDRSFAEAYTELFRERVDTYNDFWEQGYYFFEDIKDFDSKNAVKRWKKEENQAHFKNVINLIASAEKWDAHSLSEMVKNYVAEENAGFGNILPLLRIALAGTMQGPDVFLMMDLMGKELCVKRLKESPDIFQTLL